MTSLGGWWFCKDGHEKMLLTLRINLSRISPPQEPHFGIVAEEKDSLDMYVRSSNAMGVHSNKF